MCHAKRLLSEPLFTLETGVQEFNRYPSTVKRQLCFCLMQWCDRQLTAFGMSHRTAPPQPLFSIGAGAQPVSFKWEPIKSVYMYIVITAYPIWWVYQYWTVHMLLVWIDATDIFHFHCFKNHFFIENANKIYLYLFLLYPADCATSPIRPQLPIYAF